MSMSVTDIMEEELESNGMLVEDEQEKDTFILNTNTMCFLCLEEISREEEAEESGDEEGAKNQLNLFDKEGPHIKIEPGLSPPPPSSSVKPPLSSSSSPRRCQKENNIISLLSIVRYLKVKWSEVFTRYLQLGGDIVDLHVPEKVSKISVMLCEDCNMVTSKLSTLCLELELLKMRVDDQLKAFCGVLQYSEKCVDRLAQLQNMSIKDDNGGLNTLPNGVLADVLRMEIKNKCNIKEKSALPRIMIPAPGRNANVPIRASGDVKRFIQCHLCYPRRNLQPLEVRAHKIYHHVETFMTQYQQPQLTLHEFKEYCDYVFKVELLLCPKLQDGGQLKCSSCSKVYSCNYSLRYHLFSEHKALLGKKLSELQRSTTIDEVRSIQSQLSFSTTERKTEQVAVKTAYRYSSKNSSQKATKSSKMGLVKGRGSQLPFKSKKGEKCTLCDPPSEARYRILRLHVIRNHAESFFTKYKREHLSMSNFKHYCDHILKVEMLSTSKQYSENGNPASVCSICSKQLTNVMHMRAHLIFDHKDVLSKKLVELQNSTSISEIRAASTNLSLMGLRCYKCINCGAAFSQECSLYRHKKLKCGVGRRVRGASKTRGRGGGVGRPRGGGRVGISTYQMKKRESSEEPEEHKPQPVAIVHPKVENTMFHDEGDEDHDQFDIEHPPVLERYDDLEQYEEEEEVVPMSLVATTTTNGDEHYDAETGIK